MKIDENKIPFLLFVHYSLEKAFLPKLKIADCSSSIVVLVAVSLVCNFKLCNNNASNTASAYMNGDNLANNQNPFITQETMCSLDSNGSSFRLGARN